MNPFEGLAPPEPWTLDAVCAQIGGDICYPEKGESVDDAKTLCETCPVREQCLDYALRHDEKFGVWGGLSESERRVIKRQGNTPTPSRKAYSNHYERIIAAYKNGTPASALAGTYHITERTIYRIINRHTRDTNTRPIPEHLLRLTRHPQIAALRDLNWTIDDIAAALTIGPRTVERSIAHTRKQEAAA